MLSTAHYNDICAHIHRRLGLALRCEAELHAAFPHIAAATLDSILAKEWQQHTKLTYPRIAGAVRRLLAEYDQAIAHNAADSTVLVRLAQRERFPPIGLCRVLLTERYRDLGKPAISEMLRNPYAVPDERLAANVFGCLHRDNRDGPLADAIRQCIGEEYEVRMKRLATEAGLHYHDEGDLRRGGYDKTPDLKLTVPCLFRGRVVNWFESKALFGDADAHRRYLREQLSSYANRFGPGVVVYWFGYLDQVAEWPENQNVVMVTAGFPRPGELELLAV